jgi:ubiquitin C-terminal hydrolase
MKSLWTGSGPVRPTRLLSHIQNDKRIPDMYKRGRRHEDMRMAYHAILQHYLSPSGEPTLFSFDLLSNTVCGVCSNEASTLDGCTDINLTFEAGGSTLQSLISHYFRTENLDDLDNLYAPRGVDRCGCASSLKSTRTLSLMIAPAVLVFTLKRFSYDAFKRTTHKVSTKIEYPVAFDVGEYVDGSPTEWYDLVAVGRHFGDKIEGGHFKTVAMHQTDRNWYEFDDHDVTRLDRLRNEGDGSEYMFFYVRRRR